MRIFACLTCTILFSAGAVLAQGGTVALFADPGGTDCGIIDSEPNSVAQAYVFHLFTPGARAAGFSVPVPACATGLVWLSDVRVLPFVVGFSHSGVWVHYQQCLGSPIHILTIQYWGQGTTEECCVLNVEPIVEIGVGEGIWAIDCDFEYMSAAGASAMVNPNSNCPCFNVPVEKSTWGRVKALYAD